MHDQYFNNMNFLEEFKKQFDKIHIRYRYEKEYKDYVAIRSIEKFNNTVLEAEIFYGNKKLCDIDSIYKYIIDGNNLYVYLYHTFVDREHKVVKKVVLGKYPVVEVGKLENMDYNRGGLLTVSINGG